MKQILFKIFSLLFFLVIINCGINGQYFSIKPEIMSIASLIKIGNYTGSGFILIDSSQSNIYLISARHVFYNQENKIQNDICEIIAYSQDTEKEKPNFLQLNLKEAFKASQIKEDINNDVIVIQLGKKDSVSNSLALNNYVKKLSRYNFQIKPWFIPRNSKISSVDPGQEIFIIGYPTSLSMDFVFSSHRPLIRKGIIAGIDLKYKRIIGDIMTNQGNSGGLVLAISPIEGKDRPDLTLIGLISAYIPFDDILFDNRNEIRSIDHKNSGYTVIIPFDFIDNLIKQFN